MKAIFRYFDDVKNKIPIGEWIYSKEISTNISDRSIAEEFTREKIYQYVHKEIPYSIIIETENWNEKSKNVVQIHQNIYVTANNHKKILLGKNGEKILEETLNHWDFDFEKKKSITNKESFLLNIKNIKKKFKN